MTEIAEVDLSLSKEKIHYKKVFRLLTSLIVPYKKVFVNLFLSFTIATVLRMSGPLIIKHIIDYAIKSGVVTYVILGASVFLTANFLFFIINYYAFVKLINTSQRIIQHLKSRLYEHILSFDMDYFTKNSPGKIAARVQNDTNSVYEIFSEVSITIFIDLIMFLTVFSIMFYHNKELTLLLLPMIMLAFLFIVIFVKKTQSMFVEIRKRIAHLTSAISEFLNIHSVIRLNMVEDKINERFEKVNYDKFIKTISAEYVVILFFLTILFLDPLSKATIFGYGGIKVLDSQMSIGTVVMFVLYIGQLFEPLFRFSEYVGIVQRSFAALERVNNLFETKPSFKEGRFFIDSFDYIEFKDVWMRYPQSSWVLKGLSFRLDKGKTLAIVGRTGEGKSTIANVIFRFYDYQKGNVIINGIELKDININSLRRRIGFVQQTMYLFPVSLRDNLRFMDEEIDDERIYYAIEVLGLREFYQKHPLDMEIKERGSNLSVGEKQIISLTRALVLDQDLIILDEATSNVDPYTEALINQAIKKIMKYKSLIIIAHRLSTVINSDYIAFLKDGRFVEYGTHEELLKLQGEYYTYFTYNF